MSKKDIFIDYFENVKHLSRKQDSRSAKYTIFIYNDKKNLYIGNNGAIRVGKSTSESISVTDIWGPKIITFMETYKKQQSNHQLS